MKQRKYPSGFKERALARVFGRGEDQSIHSIADELKMNLGTLKGWIKETYRDQKRPSSTAIEASEWTMARRLLALHETHGLEAEALNGWCRERGLFAHDLTQWRSDFCAAPKSTENEESAELRQLKLQILELERDLNRKDKALAEAAALLVLQKKYRALWAAEDG
jgi:transposase-like protein